MISIVILAAGTGSRIGETKQVLPLGGKPVLQHVIDSAADTADSGVEEILLVVGHEADRVRGSVALPGHARVVVNMEYGQGQTVSLVAGLEAADPVSEAAIVLMGDQPGVTPNVLVTLAQTYERSRMPLVQAQFRDGPGPALLAATLWDDVAALTADASLQEFVAEHEDLLEPVAFDLESPPDIDTAADYQRAREIYG